MEELKARILEMVEDYEEGISVLDNDMAQAGIDPKSDFVNTIEQLLEERECRAREEGGEAERDRIFRGLDSIDCIKEALPKNYSASGMQFGIYRAKEIVLEKELSKLTTK